MGITFKATKIIEVNYPFIKLETPIQNGDGDYIITSIYNNDIDLFNKTFRKGNYVYGEVEAENEEYRCGGYLTIISKEDHDAIENDNDFDRCPDMDILEDSPTKCGILVIDTLLLSILKKFKLVQDKV